MTLPLRNAGSDHPIALALLLLVPLIALFYALALRARRKALRVLLDEHPELGRGAGWNRRALEAALAVATFGFVVVSLTGPRWGRERETVKRSGADVVVVLDVSRSMLSQDIEPSRLDRARREIRGLLDSASNDRIALVTFAGDARVVCPLTLDHDTLGMFVDEADPNSDHRGGSNLARALDAAGTALEASAGAGKAVVVLSDGEDFNGKGSPAVAAAARLYARGARVHAIGLGSREGAKIPVTDLDSHAHFFQDGAGVEVVTKLEPATLQAVAEAGGGEYLEASQVAFPMDELWNKRISRLAHGDTGTDDISSLKARYQWFLAPGILAAMLWWIVPLGLGGSMRAPRRRKVAAAPRHSPAVPGSLRSPGKRATEVLLLLGILLAGLLLVPGLARADAVEEGARGDRLYRKGDFDGAAAAYDYASHGAAAPNGPFNLGDAKFRAGKFGEADRAFSEAQKRTADPKTQRDASYNRGNALLAGAAGDDSQKMANLKAAIDAYSEALKLDPTDADARRNRAIAIARWVQQSEGGSQQQKNKDPKPDPQNQQKQDGQGQKPDDKQQQPGDKKDGQQNQQGGQPSPSGTPTPADAKPGATPATPKDAQQKPDGSESPDATPASPQDLDRLERMLDQKEKAQRDIERRKAHMHRQPGENEW